MSPTVQQTDDYPDTSELLCGVGHPLLDVCINVDEKFLSAYNFKHDDAILAGPQHNDLIEYCFKAFDSQLKLNAGGATQNSIRTAQWVLDFYDQKKTLFLGTVGDDDYATMLEEQAKRDHVEPLYCKVKSHTDQNNNSNIEQIESETDQKNESNERIIEVIDQQVAKSEFDPMKTGVCLAFITNNGNFRSMVTFLGAAKQLNASHLDNYMHRLKRSSLFFCGGFLLSSSFEAVLKISEFCRENNKKFALNLSAPYICSNYGNLIAQLIPSLDLIFGNEKEFREFANYHHFGTEDFQVIAMKIFDTFQCLNKEQLIIITQNKHAVLCFLRSKRVGFKQHVPKMDKDEIFDTIGAGDSFAGGFMAYYLMGRDIDLCLKCGIYCARQIIKKTGCNFDGIKFDEQHLIDLFNPK